MAYGGYRGQCIGRLLRFLYDYNMNVGEYSIFHGDGKITMHTDDGAAGASGYTWNNDGDGDIPTFTFVGDYYYLNDVQKQRQPKIITYDKLRNPVECSKSAEEEVDRLEKEARWEKIRSQIMSSCKQ
jgi:hypothetical protein